MTGCITGRILLDMKNATSKPAATVDPILVEAASDLDAFFAAHVTATVQGMANEQIVARHEALCAEFAAAMREGNAMSESSWRWLGALQTERALRAA